MSWPRAVAVAAVLLVVGIALLVVVPNLLVTRVTGLDRGARLALASIWFLIALSALAWTLRRLQARHVV